MTLRLLVVAVMLSLAACSDDSSWRTKSIDGVLPDLAFELTSESGETIGAADFRGRVTAMFFGYTSCPDVCPVTLAKLRDAIVRMPEDTRDGVSVLFVSVDPARDTPDVLRAYTDAFGPQFVGLTGSEAVLRALTKHYRATFSYDAPGPNGYLVSHPSAVYVFDRRGRARLLVREIDLPDAIAHDLQRLIEDGR